MTIDAFWSWWAGARGAVAGALEAQQYDAPIIGELHANVIALGLVCELGPGLQARHAVCVSSQGDPSLRKQAYRWRDASPGADAEFEYHPGRLAPANAADLVLEVEGDRFAFSQLHFAITLDVERLELDLVVEHPEFPRLAEEARLQIGYLALDSVLGEEEVERWVGAIEWSAAPPSAPSDIHELRARVQALRVSAPPEHTWAVLRGQDALAIAARPLRPVDHPYFDHVCELSMLLEDGDLSALQDQEEELHAAFAGRAFHAASLTAGGERTAFVYVDGDRSTPVELAAWASERGYEFDSHRDPAWEAVRPFR